VLAANRGLSIQLEKQAITLILTLKDPAGKTLFEGMVQPLEQSTDVITLLTETAGAYTLKIEPAFAKASRGRYRLKLDESSAISQPDRERFRAQQIVAEADRLGDLGSREGHQASIKELTKAIEIWQSLKDDAAEARTLQRLGQRYFWLNNYDSALPNFNRALELRRTINDKAGEAETLRSLGSVYIAVSNVKTALENLNAALLIQQNLGERWQLAATYTQLGTVYLRLGKMLEMNKYFTLALDAFREVGDPRSAAGTLTSLSNIDLQIGDYQSALNRLPPSVEFFRDNGYAYEEAAALNNLGMLYYNLGYPEKAVTYYVQSRACFQYAGHEHGESQVIINLGIIYDALGDTNNALKTFKDSAVLTRKLQDGHGEAVALYHAGRVLLRIRNYSEALKTFQDDLSLSQSLGQPQNEAYALKGLGDVYAAMGNRQQALEFFDRAEPLMKSAQSHQGHIQLLYSRAHAAVGEKNLVKGQRDLKEAVKIVESLRAGVAGPNLRISYLAEHQALYEFYIEVLMRLHEASPQAGYDAIALQVSERKRARVLLESLAESGANIREGIDPKLLERERSSRKLLNALEQLRSQILARKHTEEELATADRKVNAQLDIYNEIQAQIRASSPRYAALTQPQPLNLKEIQAQLDPNTLLLVYSLGSERSFLFTVSTNAIESYVLDPRKKLEDVATQLYDRLKSKTWRGATRSLEASRQLLSQQALGPAVSKLSSKRLVIVTDGKLQYVPFAALPEPGKSNNLGEDHEIVYLPSASALGQQRLQLSGRASAPKTVAIIADPVYAASDERLVKRARKRGVSSHGRGAKDPLNVVPRSAAALGIQRFDRLRFSSQEADAITELVSPDQQLRITGFAASRKNLASTDLKQFRIIHFGVHGILNEKNPELSGLLLSLYDEKGLANEGLLPGFEIYNLKLGADLVVLSACETAIGREVKGEGLINIARAFMYAGAPRVVVSLWKVDDRATAELMRNFYQGMLRDNLRPAAALQAAQMAMARKPNSPWSAPYYWAGFVLEGEWR
jgi:CHAT domain-containing protein/Flp pilus assembly protein TadD